MRQSNIIFATLLFAFIVYITLRGQLPAYMALFSKEPYAGSSNDAATGSNPIEQIAAAYSQFV